MFNARNGDLLAATAVWPGDSYPLGASYDGAGTNFGLFSEVAERVELCLFDDDGNEKRVDLREVDGFVWHGYLPGVGPGQRYGYRVHGPYDPAAGQRCNPAKLLLDPYAKAIDGHVTWGQPVFSYPFGHPDRRNNTDSAPHVPRSVVINPYFDWGPGPAAADPLPRDRHLRGARPRADQGAPGRPEEQRGTYLGLAHPAIISHLHRLGVTAVELMPVHQFVTDSHLKDRGLHNYWGYNTIGFFAPHNGYAAERPARRAGAGVQDHGPHPARGRDRGDPRRGLQPHRRGQPPGADAVLPRHRQRRTTGWWTTTGATTWTPPAPGTACSCGTRTCCR
jgi:isoamylase